MGAIISTVAANREVVVYWGQQSYSKEGTLRSYCADSTIDILVIGFVYDFPTSGKSSLPGINIAGHCNDAFSNSNPNFLDCSSNVGPDITYCQQQGKKVFMSFGGADGTYGFTGDSQAQTFADLVWNMFLGGSYAQRPFGTAIVDGIDLDIESGANNGPGFAAFITQLRSHFTAQTARTYYISGAPQCPEPDQWLGPGKNTALGTAWFDYVWVQFYNNYCGLDNYPSQFNFNVWAQWAQTGSVNPNVKVLIGAPASAGAAGEGYVSAATLQTVSNAMAASYPNVYGGIMLWDAGTSQQNNNFAGQLAAFLHDGSAPSVAVPVPTVTPSAAPSAKTTTTTTTTGKTSKTTTTTTTTTGKAGKTTTTTTTTGKSGSKGTTTTTGKSSGNAPVISSPTAAAPSTPAAGGSCSTLGYMKCATSETYQVCDHNLWSVQMSCPQGLTCTPSGNYIYCQ